MVLTEVLTISCRSKCPGDLVEASAYMAVP